ncbi:MAG: hypothetical protein ACE3JP_00345 [Ectobacillus sp.]
MKNRNMYQHEFNRQQDARYEGPVNDNLPTGGGQMGVRVDIDPTLPKQQKNPYHATPKVDEEMKEFRSLMQGEEK